MPDLKITNNDSVTVGVSDPHGTFYMNVAGGATETKTVTVEELENMRGQLAELDGRNLADGSDAVAVDVIQGKSEDDVSYEAATADVTRYLANRVVFGAAASNPSTASTVSARRIDIAAGEAFVDGLHEVIAAAADKVPDAEYLADGADFSATALSAGKARSATACLVNNGGTIEHVWIYSDEANDIPSIPQVSGADFAEVIQAHLGEDEPVYTFVIYAAVIFSEDTGLTQITTDLRPVPPSYN